MTNLEQAQKLAEVAQERVVAMQKVAELDQVIVTLLAGGTAATGVATVKPAVVAKPKPVVANGDAPKPRGRPPGSKNKTEGITVVASPEGKMNLPALLTHIAQTSRNALKLADFVERTREAGYQSDAKDFPNMVYQALLKLCGQSVLKRDKELRVYTVVAA